MICECVFGEDLIFTALYWLISGVRECAHHLASSNLSCPLFSEHALLLRCPVTDRMYVFVNSLLEYNSSCILFLLYSPTIVSQMSTLKFVCSSL